MSLPLDLLPYILGSLNTLDLKSCNLVTVAFHRNARRLLFTHLIFCLETWAAKARFLLSGEGASLRPYVKKITLGINEDRGPYYVGMDLEDQLLHSLLETLGPQLDAFCIQSVDDCNWDEFPDSFLDIFTTQVMPRIRSLDLNRIILIPLLATLRHCPHLQSLSLSERNYIIGASESGTGTGDIVPYTLPRVTSLEVEIFGLEDFEDDQGAPTSLKQLILLSGASIRSLYLGMCSSMYFPLKWEFLYPFHDLRNSLAHLAFGSHLYESVVFQFNNSTKDRDMGLDFWMFPQLQSISILIPIHTSPTGWGPWSRCLAQSLDYPHQAKLRILKFILLSNYYPVPASSTNPLDHMAKAVKFKIHVVTCGDLDEAVFAETAQAFRMDLPSWDADEKLEFWMGE